MAPPPSNEPLPQIESETFALPTQISGRERTVLVSNGPAFLCGRPLGEILVHLGHVRPDKMAEALAVQKEKGGRIGEVLISLKAVSEEHVLQALAAQLDLRFMKEVRTDTVNMELVKRIPINFAKQARVLPLNAEGEVIPVVFYDPLDTAAMDHVRTLVGQAIEPRVATQLVLLDAINASYDRAAHEGGAMMENLDDETGSDLNSLAQELEEPQDLLDAGDDEAPIIRLVNSLLKRSVKEKVSDIHIEPYERDVAVRFRKDGVLHEIIRPPKRYQKAIASRVKIMGQLNIAETRLPQDGRIRIKIAGKDVDIRLSTIPTAHGERIVMRLLDKSSGILDLAQIGFSEGQLKVMTTLIAKSHGIILVTGPTGSGKTTTLYAALSRINKPDLNILTAEDPVEYQLQGIGQTPVNAKIGLTFAGALRSFLRQDPDVIMVGEIRDLETAEIAIQASLTGHLVFSTVHTNDAPGAVTRLVEMGVEPFLVASSVVGIVAQRLVRQVCLTCRVAYVPSDEELAEVVFNREKLHALGTKHIYKASEKGCDQCENTGYKGRTAIYETMMIDDDVRQLVLKNVDSNTIKKAAVKNGMVTLIEDGARKVGLGVTTLSEVLWVAQQDVG